MLALIAGPMAAVLMALAAPHAAAGELSAPEAYEVSLRMSVAGETAENPKLAVRAGFPATFASGEVFSHVSNVNTAFDTSSGKPITQYGMAEQFVGVDGTAAVVDDGSRLILKLARTRLDNFITATHGDSEFAVPVITSWSTEQSIPMSGGNGTHSFTLGDATVDVTVTPADL